MRRLTGSLYVRFALLAGIALAVAGAASLWHAQGDAAGTARLGVWKEAAFMADRLGRDDFARAALFQPATGETQTLLDDVFGGAVVSPGILRVTLVRPDGIVTYSSDHELIGMPADRPDLVGKAIGQGRAWRQATVGGRAVLASYVPVSWVLSRQGGASGVLVVYRDYAPIAAETRQLVQTEAATLALAMLLLYVALFPILRSITGRLAATAAENLALERRVRMTHRAEAVGRLAAGVAHDFNNLLTGIGSYAELVVTDVAADSPARWHAEEIRKATARGAALTRHLLDFEQRRPATTQVVDLNAILGDTLPLLQRLIGEDVDLDVQRADGVLPVETDPAQLEQLIVDLVLNGRDAIPTGGTITVTTRAEADRMVLLVADSGADSQARHGLEVAALWELVGASGGTIELAADPHAGSIVRVALPLADGHVAELRRQERQVVAEPDVAASTVVLLVEDEEIVRAVVREVLETAGYTVVAAHNGRLALELCAERDERIDVLVSDVVMPELGGIELAEQLRESYPHLAVVLMSGYPDRHVTSTGMPIRWLQKPFSHADLLQEVRASLAERPAEAALA